MLHRRGKRPFFEEHVCCLRRLFAIREHRGKYSGLKKAIVIEPGSQIWREELLCNFMNEMSTSTWWLDFFKHVICNKQI